MAERRPSGLSDDRRAALAASLQRNRAELTAELSRQYRASAFSNQYILHPRILGDLAEEDAEVFLRYAEAPDAATPRNLGRARAEKGLGRRSLVALGTILRRFCIIAMAGQGPDLVAAGVEFVDAYIAWYREEYDEEMRRRILVDQEQLRHALAEAIERQRREILVKDYAINTAIYGVVLTDLDGRITYVNPAFLRMWHLESPEEALGRSVGEFVPDTEVDAVKEHMSKYGGWEHEGRGRRASGSAFDVGVTASFIRDQAERSTGIMVTFVEVTERKRLEAQFRQAQKMDALGQLAAGIVHDFNNLLTSISGFAQMDLMELEEGNPLHQDLLQIKIAADRGKELTQQLRVFTQQTSSTRELIDINDVVSETAALVKRTFPPSVSVELNLEKASWAVQANASQIGQLLMNLCVNARDAVVAKLQGLSDSDGGTDETAEARITIETENVELDAVAASRFIDSRPGNYVRLRVSDTGEGILPEIRDRLFEPFFTTKSGKRGLGLGLTVVYGIVRNHNGFIDVVSEPGRGTSFEIYLPSSATHIAGDDRDAYASSITAGEGGVLLVDDEEQIRQMGSRVLERAGYRVYAAANGKEALELYRRSWQDVDVVILDVVMPEMDGRACFERLREVNPEAKVLVMTGYTSDGSVREFLSKGAVGIVEKPFEIQELTEAVRRAAFEARGVTEQ